MIVFIEIEILKKIKAAAGGMGTILCQLCRNMGAFVIGTVSNKEKAQIAKENGRVIHKI